MRIAIADDHRLFRLGLTTALSAYDDIEIAIDACSIKQLFSLLPQEHIDVLLLDVLMPEIDGIEGTRLMRLHYPDVKVLILSSAVDEKTIRALMEAGIDGFINKAAPIEEIVEALHIVATDGCYYGKDISAIMRDVLAARNQLLATTGLTEREIDIIRDCCEGLTGKEIADRRYISARTVEGHKASIFRKLGINTSVEVVLFAIRNGIVSV